MLLLAIMWGLSIPVTKLGLLTLPPLTLTALRFAIAVPLLVLFTLGRKQPPWRALPSIAALGVLGIGVGQVAQAFGVAGTSASVGTIISAAIPIFVVMFAALRLKQPVSRRQKLGLLAAFAGIALVALGNTNETSVVLQTSIAGAGLMLLSALAVAFYYVWSVELSHEYGTVTVAAWSTLFGFVALLPWAGWEMWHVPFHVTAQALWAGVYLGLAVSVAGLFLWLNILRTVPTGTAASVQYLQPVFGVAASSAIFGDRIGGLFAVGVTLVLGGLALAISSRSKTDQAT
ncbi:DMT family transporter [Microvirga sp. TS319]|uniref:DMT family transporter n=1 Tax=Microvirga sp. TS319 TaxID=3241165 RepID=UPI00351AA9F1